MTRGIVIVSCGVETDSYMPLAVASIRRHCNLPITVHQEPDKGGVKSRAVKLRMDEISPYDQTLYVDCDTLTCQDPTPIFSLLDHDPLWMCIDVGPRTISECMVHHFFQKVVKAYPKRCMYRAAGRNPNAPHFNSGVVLFDRRAAPFFAAWRQIWASFPPGQDQVALMIASDRTGQRPASLSPRWNFQHSRSKDEKDLAACRSQIRILHLLGGEKPMLYERARQAGLF